MSSFTKVMTMQQRVMQLLKANAAYRDDDNKLVARIWNNHLEGMEKDPNKITAYDMLCLYATGEIPTADAITRARRKVQEENSELRGTKWEERQKEAKGFAEQVKV